MKMTPQSTATRLLWGAGAGAVGTVVLNAVSFGDMLVRGRASSNAPAQLAAASIQIGERWP